MNLNLLPGIATETIGKLREAGWTGDIRPQQTLAFAEEAGEAVGAARRYLGMARRTGTKEDVAHELADVLLTAFVLAELLEINLPAALDEKVAKIFSRPWRDEHQEEITP